MKLNYWDITQISELVWVFTFSHSQQCVYVKIKLYSVSSTCCTLRSTLQTSASRAFPKPVVLLLVQPVIRTISLSSGLPLHSSEPILLKKSACLYVCQSCCLWIVPILPTMDELPHQAHCMDGSVEQHDREDVSCVPSSACGLLSLMDYWCKFERLILLWRANADWRTPVSEQMVNISRQCQIHCAYL